MRAPSTGTIKLRRTGITPRRRPGAISAWARSPRGMKPDATRCSSGYVSPTATAPPQCPHCLTLDPYRCITQYKSRAKTKATCKRGRDYEAPLLRRFYKCRNPECRKTFTVTSGTKWDSRKLPIRDLLLGMMSFQSARLGLSALEITRILTCTHPTALIFARKVREAVEEQQNEGLLDGEVVIDSTFLTSEARRPNLKEHWVTPEYQQYLAEQDDRKLTIATIRQIRPVRRTRTAVFRTEGPEATAWAAKHISPHVASLTSDMAGTWKSLRRALKIDKSRMHVVNHSISYVNPEGTNTNPNESFHWCLKTSLKSVYMSGVRYIETYSAESGWRMDNVRITPAEQFALLVHATATSQRSRWTGYWQRGNRAYQRAAKPRPDFKGLNGARTNDTVYRRSDRTVLLRDVVATLQGSHKAADRHRRQAEAFQAARRRER